MQHAGHRRVSSALVRGSRPGGASVFDRFGLSLLHTHLAVGASLVITNQSVYPNGCCRSCRPTTAPDSPACHRHIRFSSARLDSNPRAFPRFAGCSRLAAGSRHRASRKRLTRFRTRGLRDVRADGGDGETELSASRTPARQAGFDRQGPSVDQPRGADTARHAGSGRLGDVGEIVATGENITRGYWNDPEETARYFRDGRLHTGDSVTSTRTDSSTSSSASAR